MSVNVGDVESILRLIDQFSPVLAVIQANMGAFTAKTEGDVERLSISFTRMSASLDGSKIINQAALTVAAIENIGGVTKLTAAEQNKANLIFTEAIAKMNALGMSIPPLISEYAALTGALKQQEVVNLAHIQALKMREAETIAVAKAETAAWEMVAKARVAQETMVNTAHATALKMREAETIAAAKAEDLAWKMVRAEEMNALKNSANQYRTIGRDMQNFGMTMTMFVTAPIILAGKAVMQQASDYEASVMKLHTLSDVPIQDAKRMGDAIKEMAVGLGRGPQELIEAQLQVTSTGIRDVATSLDILKLAAQGSAVGLGTVTDVAKTITSIVQAYGKENISAAEATNILYKTVVEGKGELTEFAGSMGRVVGLAASVGVSLADVGTYLAVYTRLGVSAAEATTALRATLQRLELKDTKPMNDALALIGTNVLNLRKEIQDHGLVPTLIDLRAAFDKIGRIDALAAVIPQVRALAGVISVTGAQAKDAVGVFKHLGDGVYDFGEAVGDTAATTKFKWDQVKASFSLFTIELGTKLIPRLQELIPWLEKVASKLIDWVEAFANLDPWVQKAALGLVAFAALLGPSSILAGGVARAIALFKDLVLWVAGKGGLSAALAGALPGIATYTLAIIGIGTALYTVSAAYDWWNAKQELNDLKLSNEERGVRAIAWVYDNLKIRVYSAAEAYRLMGEYSEKLRNKFLEDAKNKPVVPALTSLGGTGLGDGTVTPSLKEAAKAAEELAKAYDKVEAAESRTGKSHEQFNTMLINSGTLVKGIEGGAYNDLVEKLNAIESGAHSAGDAIYKMGTELPDELPFIAQSMSAAIGAGFRKTLTDFPKTMISALTGGGDVGGAFSSFFSDIGANIGTNMFGKLAAKASSSLFGMFGKNITSALGDIIPGIGGMIGSLAGPAIEWIGNKLFKTEGKHVNDLRDAFMEAQGGYIKLHQSLIDAGAEALYFQLQSAGNMKDWEAAQKAVTAALDAYNAKLKEEAQLKSDIAATEKEIADLEAQLIPTWDQVSGIIDKYKINVDALGVSVQQLKITDISKTIVEDWDTMSRAGAEMGIVAEGMKDQINKVVQEAAKFGTELPSNMKPALEKMIELGLLVDANGIKITDLSGIKFGEPVKTEADKIRDAIKELVEKLGALIDKLTGPGGVTDSFAEVGRTKVPTIHIPYKYDPDNEIPGVPPVFPQAAGGDYWVTKPTMFLAGEKGPERATFSGAGNLGGGGLGGGTTAIENKLDLLLTLLPAAMGKAVRDAVLIG